MPTHEVKLTVTIQVESDEELSRQRAQEAAREAVENAVRSGENMGFEHQYATTTSLAVVSVENVMEPTTP